MIQTFKLSPGITLRCCRDTRFKQGCLSFQIIRPMRQEENAMNALLPSVLLRGTKNHGDLRAITHRLDELYGASVSAVVRRVGDYQTTGLYCGFMDDRFALPGDQVLAPMLAFLEELLLDSTVEEGGFLPAFVDSEKKNLIARFFFCNSFYFSFCFPCKNSSTHVNRASSHTSSASAASSCVS